MDVCQELYTFNDTNSNYIEERKTDYENYMNMIKEQSPDQDFNNVFSIFKVNEEYVQFMLFNRQVRRVGNSLYWNRDNNTDFFNTECGPYSEFLEFASPNFFREAPGADDSAMSRLNLYTAKIEDNDLAEERLDELDEILNSLHVK